MKNLLLVEDEVNISLAIKTMTERAFANVMVFVASNGREALDCFHQHPIDLVISDWNMPGMSGGELLKEIRGGMRNNQVPFLMLTARADGPSVQHAISQQVTEYIVKPFNRDALIEKIRKCMQLSDKKDDSEIDSSVEKRALFAEISEKIKSCFRKGQLNFPVLSEIGLKAVDIVHREDSRFEELFDVIRCDQSIASKVMSVANSSFYRGQSPSESLKAAITRIGLKEAGNIILTYSYRELFLQQGGAYFSRLKELWEHSLSTAICARVVAAAVGIQNLERLYAAAMFHDIGKLLLLSVLLQLEAQHEDIDDDVIDKLLAEMHVQFGIELLQYWNFSALFTDVIRLHHSTEKFSELSKDVRVVILANQMSKVLTNKHLEEHSEHGIMAGVAKNLDLSRQQLGELLKASYDQFIQVRKDFYPDAEI